MPVGQGDLDRVELAERPAYGGLGGAQPPDEVVLGAGAEAAQPAPDQLAVAGLGRVVVDRRAEPLLGQRPPRPRDAPVALVAAAEDLAGRRRACRAPVARSGSCRRRTCRAPSPAAGRAAGSARAARRWWPGRPRPARRRIGVERAVEPDVAALGDARGPRPPWPAGCAAAGPPAPRHSPTPCGSSSRGKVNSVRRMASCLTTVRSS